MRIRIELFKGPKVREIKEQSKKRVQWIEDWINTMYRKSLGWKTAEQRYQEEVDKLIRSGNVQCV